MQIEINEAGGIVIGKWHTDTLEVYKTTDATPAWKAWTRQVAEANGVILSFRKKEFNQQAADMFKRSPTAMYGHFKKLAYKQFVMPYRDVLVKVAFSRGRINIPALNRIRENFDVVNETWADGLHHLLPIVVNTGKSPAQLKKEFGAKWKIIANNTLNKNKALAKSFNPKDFAKFCDKPTTVIQAAGPFVRRGYQSEELEAFAMHATKHMKGKWSNKRAMGDTFMIVRDSCSMARQLNLKIDPNWTPRRFKEEHDKMSQEINARRYPKTAYESLKDIKAKNLEIEGYSVTLLESGFDIAEEGNQMGHCVGSYSSSVAEGVYLVYSVKKDGDRSSTIGLSRVNWKADGDFTLNQQYGRFNTRVVCDVEKSIPHKILEILNKKEVQ